MSLVHVSPEPTSLAQVDDQCAAVEQWAEQCESVPQLQDASNKLAAINEYLDRTSRDGRARVAAARRKLEVRIGQVLGEAERGRPAEGSSVATELSRHERHDFRQMAANADVVNDVIEHSTDENPPSRRKVIDAIKHNSTGENEPVTRRRDLEERAQQAQRMAREGKTSTDIAKALGVSESTIHNDLKRADWAPRASGRAVLDRITEQATGLALAADQTGGSVKNANADEVARWVGDLTRTIRSLSQLRTRIKESN